MGRLSSLAGPSVSDDLQDVREQLLVRIKPDEHSRMLRKYERSHFDAVISRIEIVYDAARVGDLSPRIINEAD